MPTYTATDRIIRSLTYTAVMPPSLFSYNITRAYPYGWVTPAVVVGGIIASILVSLISIGTSGYQLISIPSSNPNVTESTKTWFRRRLGVVLGSMQPTCASATIPLHATLYSNNTALPYELTQIAISGRPQGSLVYHNNPLQNCSISGVVINFEILQRPAESIGVQAQDAMVSCSAVCAVETSQGVAEVELSTSYDYVSNDYSSRGRTFNFLGRNATTQASLYWAESLLLMYWIELTISMIKANGNDDDGFYKGFVNLTQTHGGKAPSNREDVKSLDFFEPQCFFFPFSTSTITSVSYCGNEPNTTVAQLAAGPDSAVSPLPGIWIPADSLSKVMYYTVLADLGQTDPPYASILTDTELLSYFTENFTAIKASTQPGVKPWGMNIGVAESLAWRPFDQADEAVYDLKINPSTLATTYICQVPRLKPAGTLFVSVLIADLVLLRTIWSASKLVLDSLLLGRHPELKYCEGCSAATAGSHDQAATEGAPSTTKGRARGDYIELRSLDVGPSQGGEGMPSQRPA